VKASSADSSPRIRAVSFGLELLVRGGIFRIHENLRKRVDPNGSHFVDRYLINTGLQPGVEIRSEQVAVSTASDARKKLLKQFFIRRRVEAPAKAPVLMRRSAQVSNIRRNRLVAQRIFLHPEHAAPDGAWFSRRALAIDMALLTELELGFME